MYVALGNVPFSSTDLHRYNDIDSKFNVVLSFENCKIIKNNVLQINSNSSNLYDNIVNFGYGFYIINSKRYYFFIDSFEYVNDYRIDININIDWFSTDFKYLKFEQSFINQMHPQNKDTFDFLPTSEPYGYNDKKYNNLKSCELSFPFNYKFIMGLTHWIPQDELLDEWLIFDNPFIYVDKCTYTAGAVNGVVYYCLDTIEQCSTVMQNAINYGYGSSITGLWLVPTNLKIDGVETKILNTQLTTGKFQRLKTDKTKSLFAVNILSDTPFFQSKAEININRSSDINGYTPVYAKCFHNDFYNYAIKSDSGMCEYNPYIVGYNNTFSINIYTNNSPNLQLIATPYNYMFGGSDIMNSMTINISVTGSLTADNSTREIRDFIGNVANSTIGGLFSVASAGITAGSGMAKLAMAESGIKSGLDIAKNSTLGGIELAQSVGKSCATLTGNNNTPFAMVVNGCNGFSFGYNAPKYEDMHNIDKLFSRYGYTMCTITRPFVRESYSYIRGDINFNSTSTISNISRNYIKQLFNAGLTIWNNNAIYNYDVN